MDYHFLISLSKFSVRLQKISMQNIGMVFKEVMEVKAQLSWHLWKQCDIFTLLGTRAEMLISLLKWGTWGPDLSLSVCVHPHQPLLQPEDTVPDFTLSQAGVGDWVQSRQDMSYTEHLEHGSLQCASWRCVSRSTAMLRVPLGRDEKQGQKFAEISMLIQTCWFQCLS